MNFTKNDADFSEPLDYADLYKKYYRYVVNTCAHLGIDEANKEDVASEILLRFMERGSLEKYDPNLNFEHHGEHHTTRFRTFLTRAVLLYTRGHREKLAKRASREVLTGGVSRNTFLGEDIPGDNWLEDLYEPQQDHADWINDMLDEEADSAGVRKLLARIPRRNAHDLCDLVALFDAVRKQILATGKYDINRLSINFGVSVTAMNTWMWWLRENLADIYGYALPPRRGRRQPKEA